MTTDVNDALMIAEQCRHHAVRTAIQHITDGEPNCALLELIQSVQRCAHLDHRPIDQARVELRANKLLAEWGNPRPCLAVVA